MRYVALLRGINVGGNNKVDMKDLRSVFEAAGMESVRTYINSGNVVFSAKSPGGPELGDRLQGAIAAHFGFEVPVVLRDLARMRALVASLPADWRNDDVMKCDVMFLWEDVDSPAVLEELRFDAAREDVRYESGAILWRVDREYVTKSGMLKLLGTPLYKRMTIRNCNTVRRLLALMED